MPSHPPWAQGYKAVIIGCSLTHRAAIALLRVMNDDSPTTPSPAHVVGEGYDFHAIRAHLGGNAAPPYFVIHADGQIRGLCLGLLWNPRAEADPCEAWIGEKGELPRWGLKLAETTGPLPVYVRREEGGPWFFIGNYEVSGTSVDPEEIKQRLQPPTITAISRIVFLKRASS
jgi:hypothetical protein